MCLRVGSSVNLVGTQKCIHVVWGAACFPCPGVSGPGPFPVSSLMSRISGFLTAKQPHHQGWSLCRKVLDALLPSLPHYPYTNGRAGQGGAWDQHVYSKRGIVPRMCCLCPSCSRAAGHISARVGIRTAFRFKQQTSGLAVLLVTLYFSCG